MRRGFLIALFATGTVLGYGSAFHHGRCHWQDRRAAYEQRWADTCVRAAQQAQQQQTPPPPATP